MKRVLITGASSGIGLELAKQYSALGCHVIACGRNAEKLSAGLPAADNVSYCICDLNDRQDVLANMGQFKNLSVVILNAGTCEYIDDAKNFDSELLQRVLETNVIGTGNCLQATLTNILAGGQLAIVSSTVTLLPLSRAEAYGASKAALDYLARALAIDLAHNDIDVSLVRPGFVATPLTDKNQFSMPGIITVERAGESIIKGLTKRRKEINFPRGFYWTLKLLSLLPNSLWHRLARKMVNV
ncbi:MAG: short-subunit dehydrogenase [Pseudohongiellaceae bacterium]|jgi:short-subunit dehydrogenase